jgi:hypothetical protein
MIRLSLYVFIWIASMAIAIFATQNISLVSIRLLNFESIKLPLGLVLVSCGGLGGIFINFWQTSLKFDAAAPRFSGFSSIKNSSKQQQTTTTTAAKKDISRKAQKNNDDFDNDLDEEWG